VQTLTAAQACRAAAAAAFGHRERVALGDDREFARAPGRALHRGVRRQRERIALGDTVDLPQPGPGRRRRRLLEVGLRSLGRGVEGRAVDDAGFDGDHIIEWRIARAAVAGAAPLAIERGRGLGPSHRGKTQRQQQRQRSDHRLPNSRSISASLSST